MGIHRGTSNSVVANQECIPVGNDIWAGTSGWIGGSQSTSMYRDV